MADIRVETLWCHFHAHTHTHTCTHTHTHTHCHCAELHRGGGGGCTGWGVSPDLVVVQAQELQVAEDAHASRHALQLIVVQQQFHQRPVGAAEGRALQALAANAIVGQAQRLQPRAEVGQGAGGHGVDLVVLQRELPQGCGEVGGHQGELVVGEVQGFQFTAELQGEGEKERGGEREREGERRREMERGGER